MAFVKRDPAVYEALWATMREWLRTERTATHEAHVAFAQEFRGPDDEIDAWLELATICVATAAVRLEAKGKSA